MEEISVDELVAIAESRGMTQESFIAEPKYRCEFLFNKILSLLTPVLTVSEMENLMKSTGVGTNLSEETVQKAFAQFARSGEGRILSYFQSVLGIKPQLTDKDVQKGYKKCVETYEYQCPDCTIIDRKADFFALNKVTGIEPKIPNELIQRRYNEFLLSGDLDLYAGLPAILEMTGVNFELPEDKLQETYVEMTKENTLHSLKVLVKTTGVKPAFSPEFVQQLYQKNVDSYHAVSNINDLFESTGAKPNFTEEQIQSIYESLASWHEVDDILTLLRITEVNPSEWLVQNVYQFCLEKGGTYYTRLFKGLVDLTCIEPDLTE